MGVNEGPLKRVLPKSTGKCTGGASAAVLALPGVEC